MSTGVTSDHRPGIDRVDVPLAALGRTCGGVPEPAPGTGEALRTFGPSLAALLEYPGPEIWRVAAEARDRARNGGRPGLAQDLGRFFDQARALGLERLREIYSRTFELAPLCAPYLSVHLFGEGSYQRGRLMAGLAEAHTRAGFDPGRELPDHLAVVLRFAPRMDPEDWRELVRYCLVPVVPHIARSLEDTSNPYRQVLEAVERCLDPGRSASTTDDLEGSER